MCFEQRYHAAKTQAAAGSHRQLLWLSGEQQWCYTQLQNIRPLLLALNSSALISKKVAQQYFDAGQQRNICRSQIVAKECAKFLGKELQAVVFDGFSGFNPDSLAIISGTLVAGGVLILITPDLNDFEHWQEPEMDNLWVQPYQLKDVKRHFLAWLKSHLMADPHLIHFSQQASTSTAIKIATDPQIAVHSEVYFKVAQREQQNVVNACYAHLKGDDTACAVLTAARGRGKSAALGLLANQIAQQKKLYLTAWDPHAVLQVNQFTRDPITFLSPAQLLDASFEPAANALLLIDEAAALSVDVLLQLSAKFPQCVYSTTTQGYEGTGQGFKLRFLEYLSTQHSNCCFYQLTLAMRWAENDPLEHWLNQLLLLDLSEVDEDVSSTEYAALLLPYKVDKIDAKRLLEQPILLRQLYALLAQAHYRTTPSDLRIIMDSPNTVLWLVRQQGDIVAACLVALEGPIDSFASDSQGQDGNQLAQAIYRGQRRPRGNLIPQILIAQEGALRAKRFKIARVVRIATDFRHRRASLATRMLDAVDQWAKQQGIDYLGANFSMQNDLATFWQQSGFSLIRVGSQQDKITASYNVLMLKTVVGDPAFIDSMTEQLPYKLAYQQQHLFSVHFDVTALRLVTNDLSHQAYLGAHPEYLSDCIKQLHCFAYYYRSIESIGYILLLLLQKYPLSWHVDVMGQRNCELFDQYFIQQLPPAQIGNNFSLSGYRSLVKELRQATKVFVAALQKIDRQ